MSNERDLMDAIDQCFDGTLSDDRGLAKARSHMTVVAVGLTAKLGPLDAAGVLAGGAVGGLTTAFGPEKAVEYLRGLADGIENGEGESMPPVGHA